MDNNKYSKKKKGFPVPTKKDEERCLLAGIDYKDSSLNETQKNLDELERLIETAGAKPVHRITQSMLKPDNTTFFQKGKLQEIKEYIIANEIDTLVFDEELTPVQIKNIEGAINAKIIDRTELILTIFSNTAKSKLSKLQIELAKLEYTLPRLKRMWTHLSRQKGGIGLKGPGERQIEIDRRMILKRMNKIKKDLAIIKQGIDIRRKKRKDQFKVSLVGYTNSGKSTLLSKLASTPVYAENKLFSTLDALIRKVQLNDRRHILISDTVGFIRKLPHQLIESFYTTLSEIINSDMIITVIDISDSDFLKRLDAVLGVLKDIDAGNICNMFVLNKIDLIDEMTLKTRLSSFYNYDPDPVFISALKDENIDNLRFEILNRIRKNEIFVTLRINENDESMKNRIFSYTDITETVKEDDHLLIRCYIRPEDINIFKDYTLKEHN